MQKSFEERTIEWDRIRLELDQFESFCRDSIYSGKHQFETDYEFLEDALKRFIDCDFDYKNEPFGLE